MKAFPMMENREDAAVARATVGMIMMAKREDAAVARARVGLIMMAKSKEGGQSGTI